MNNPLIAVPFYDDILTLADENGQPFVAMKPIVEGIGLDWKSQYVKITDKFNSVMVIITTTGSDNKKYEMICLPLRKLPAWLYSISPNKVRKEIRDKVIRYQNECDEVLWTYWTTGQVKPKNEMNFQAVNHQADIFVSADRIFRAILRTSRAAKLSLPKALLRANIIALSKTGIDILKEIDYQNEGNLIGNNADVSIAEFIEDLRAGELGDIPSPILIMKLYAHYEEYCFTNKYKPQTIQKFSNELVTYFNCITARKRWRDENNELKGPNTFIYFFDNTIN